MSDVVKLDLQVQYKSIKNKINEALLSVLENSIFINGPLVEKFEKSFARYCGTRYAVGLNSGTDALYLSLWALGVGKGDEVITTPFTVFATSEAIMLTGAKPVYVDVNPRTLNIDTSEIKKKVSKKTKAILPVHLFGMVSEMDSIRRLAGKHNLYVVEDACQAVGATFENKKAGSLGTTGCFSFYPTKNLGAYGDGGMITTNDIKLAKRIRLIKNHGGKIKYHNEIVGVNSRLDALQASVLLTKLKYLDRWNVKRRKVAALYNRLLNNVDWIDTPSENNKIKSVYNQYTIRVKNKKRDKLRGYLNRKGVYTEVYYPIPLHLLTATRYLGYKKGNFPEAEIASKECLSLPIYPEISNKKVLKVTDLIKKFAKL